MASLSTIRLLAQVNSGLFELKENPYYPDRTVYRHTNCSKSKGKPEAIPARFLVVCPSGHMDDFPWIDFVHHQNQCIGKPLLRLQEFGPTGAARYLEVRCDTCQQSRRLSNAFGKDNLKNMPKCTGRRPHLRDYEIEPCTQKARPMILGASNMWFPVTLSTVAIPLHSGKLEKLIDKKWIKLKDAPNIGVITYLRSQGELGTELSEYSDEMIWEVIEVRNQQFSNDDELDTAPDLKAPEWQVFSDCDVSLNNDDFHLKPVNISDDWAYRDVIDQVIIVERLRETQALIGFTRIDSAGEFSDPQAKISIEPAPISRQALTWVPTDEVRGEGIFIQFNEKVIAAWEQETQIQTYADKFFEAHVRWRKARKIQPADKGFPRMRYVLLHSFSHMLIRQLALESGYSMASIRERIYSRGPNDESGPMAGILIYTAAAGSEGTLGGLAQLGEADVLENHIQQALEDAYLCASDPLCAENTPGRDARTIHGAACHACLFAPETSCERGNKYLDRSILVQTLERDNLAFFGS